MTKLDNVAARHNCNSRGGGRCFLQLCKKNLQETLTKDIMFIK